MECLVWSRQLTSACLFVGRPSVCSATVMLSACSIWYSQPCLFLRDCSKAKPGEHLLLTSQLSCDLIILSRVKRPLCMLMLQESSAHCALALILRAGILPDIWSLLLLAANLR